LVDTGVSRTLNIVILCMSTLVTVIISLTLHRIFLTIKMRHPEQATSFRAAAKIYKILEMGTYSATVYASMVLMYALMVVENTTICNNTARGLVMGIVYGVIKSGRLSFSVFHLFMFCIEVLSTMPDPIFGLTPKSRRRLAFAMKIVRMNMFPLIILPIIIWSLKDDVANRRILTQLMIVLDSGSLFVMDFALVLMLFSCSRMIGAAEKGVEIAKRFRIVGYMYMLAGIPYVMMFISAGIPHSIDYIIPIRDMGLLICALGISKSLDKIFAHFEKKDATASGGSNTP